MLGLHSNKPVKQLTEHRAPYSEESTAQLSPSVLANGRVRDDDHKTNRLLDRTPATRGGSGAGNRKETEHAVVDK